MTVISELSNSLHTMGLEQHLFAFAFLGSYLLALGQWFGTKGRLRAALAAVVAAIGFAAMADPWIHGAMLMLVVVAGIGVHIGAVWVLSRLLAPQQGSELPARTRIARPEPATMHSRVVTVTRRRTVRA